MPDKDRWSKLSMRDRADLIKIYTKHGITDLNEIRRHYNSFGDNDGRLTVNKGSDDGSTLLLDNSRSFRNGMSRFLKKVRDEVKSETSQEVWDFSTIKNSYEQIKPYAEKVGNFIPIVGTYQDVKAAIEDPTKENIGWAVASGVTDLASLVLPEIKLIKLAKAGKVAKGIKAGSIVVDVGANTTQAVRQWDDKSDEDNKKSKSKKPQQYDMGQQNYVEYANGGHLFQYGGDKNNPPKRISSLLDPDKVRNRLPADASKYLGLDPFGITNTITAGLQYIFNNDNTVQDKLNERYELLRKTDDDWKAYHEKLKKSGHNVVDWKTTKRRLLDLANDYIGLEDAKDIYLNTPQRSNTFYPSKERPTIGNIENVWASNYLSSPTVVEDYILPAIRNIRTKNTVKNAQGAPLGSIEKIGKSGKNGVSFLPILGHATVGYGTDPYRGSYVSYYDKWDVNMSGKKGGTDVVKYILGGTPVNIYDRIYLDDYYGYNSVNDYKNSKKEDPDITYGGWLPEVDISASVKSDGGQLGHITPYGQWQYPNQVTTIPSNEIRNHYNSFNDDSTSYNNTKANGGHLFAYGTDGDDDRFKIVVPGTTPETSSTIVMNPDIQKAEEIDKAYKQAVQEYEAKRYSGRNMLGATINTNKEPITLGEKLAFINNEQPSNVRASFNADTELPSIRRQRQEDAARALKLAEVNYINDVNGFNVARPWTTPNSEMSAQGAGLAAQGLFWGLDPVGMAIYEGANNAPRLFNSDKTTNEYLEEAGVPEFISPFITGGIGNGVARGIYRGFKNLYKNLPVQNQEYIQLSANNNNYKSSIKQYKDLYKFLNPDGTVRKETRIIEPKNETFNISDFDFGFGFDQDKRLMFFEPGKYIDFDLSKMSEDEVVRFFGPRAKIHKAVYDIAAEHNFEGRYAKMGKDAEQKILSGFTVSKTDPDVAAGLKDARDIYYIPEYRERFGSFGDLGNTFIDDALYRLENVELQGISNKEKILSGFDGVEGGAATGMHPTNPIITLKNYDSSKLIRDFMRHEGNHASHSGIFQPKWMQMHNEKLRPIPKKISETKSGYDNYLEDMNEIIARSKTAIEYANSIRKEGESLNEALDRLVEMSQKKYNHDIPGDVRDLTSHFTKESILKFWKGFVGVTVPGVLLPNYKNEKE